MLDKGYILVEKYPDNCEKCIFGLFLDEHMRGVCMANKLEMTPNVIKKPDWCPIKEFPKEKHYSVFDSDYYDGWNECLKSIKNE